MLLLCIACSFANMLTISISAVQAAQWNPQPLINAENLLIETPGLWELQNTNPSSQQYYDPANDLTVILSVIFKKDMAISSLDQLPKNSLALLTESSRNVQTISQKSGKELGHPMLVTEFTAESNQMNLHYIFKHIDLGDRWVEFQIFGFPSQIENATEKIDRFLNSIHSPS